MSTHADRLRKIFETHGGRIPTSQLSACWFKLVAGEHPPLGYTIHDELMMALAELCQTGAVELDGTTYTLNKG